MSALTIEKRRVQGEGLSKRWCDRWVILDSDGRVITQACTTKKEAQAAAAAGLERCRHCGGEIWLSLEPLWRGMPSPFRWVHVVFPGTLNAHQAEPAVEEDGDGR